MAKAVFRMDMGSSIRNYDKEILAEGKTIASEIKSLISTLFVCKAKTWLVTDLTNMKKRLTNIDARLVEAATMAYLLSGYLTKGKISLSPPKFSIPSATTGSTLSMDTILAKETVGKIKTGMGNLNTTSGSLKRIKDEIAAIRPEDMQMNDIEYFAARMITFQGFSKYRTVVEAKNHIIDLLEKSIQDVNAITMSLTMTVMFLPGKVTTFEGVEQRAKLSLYEEQFNRSTQIKTWQDAGKQQTKDRIAELEKAQAEYTALFGVPSPEIAAEIARLRDLRIEAAIQEGIKKKGDGGQEFKDWFYRQYKGLDPKRNFAWCDRFASWMIGQMGYRMPEGGCGYQRDYFKKFEAWHSEPEYHPKNGDAVYFNWDGTNSAAHVGIIHVAADGELYVIQGNYGGKVDYVKLSDMLKDKNGKKHVIGYGDPTKLPKLTNEK